MKRTDYDAARNLLGQIDSISSQAELIKEQWKLFSKDGGTAKLFVYTGGNTYETSLSEETLQATFSEMLKRYRSSIEEARNKMNSIISGSVPEQDEKKEGGWHWK